MLVSFSAERMVTVVSVKAMFLLFAKSSRIILAASGAQEPFSISPTVRPWKFRSVRCVMKVCMKGKISAL